MKKLDEILHDYSNCFYYDENRMKAALNGDVFELSNIGTDFIRCQMFTEAIKCWEFIVESEMSAPPAIYSNLGVCYFYGNGVDVNYEKAVNYYQKAAAAGEPFGKFNFAVALEQGKGVKRDLKRAIEFYEQAAEGGVNQAIDALIRLGEYNEMYLSYLPRNLNDDSFPGDCVARAEQSWLPSHTYKDKASEFRTYLSNNGIQYLYHFTDRSNIDSIQSHGGLFSWKYCVDHNITIHNPGGDEHSRYLDTRHGLDDYVRLSFCDDHPMAYRLKQQGASLVLLKIKVDVAWLQGTLFSDINATDNNHHIGASLADLHRIDLNATQQHFVSSTDANFKNHQAEVLVKTYIPLEYIVNIDNPISLSDGKDYDDDYDILPF